MAGVRIAEGTSAGNRMMDQADGAAKQERGVRVAAVTPSV